MTTLSQEQAFSQKNFWQFLQQMFGYAWRYKAFMIGLLASAAVVGLVDAIEPIFSKLMLDNVLVPELAKQSADPNYRLDYGKMSFYLAIRLFVAVVNSIGVYLFVKYAGRIQEYFLYDLREELFRKLQRLSFSFYDQNASGWLLSRLTSDTDRLAELISWGLITGMWGVSMMFFCLFTLILYSFKIACIVFVAFVLSTVISIRIRQLILDYSRKARQLNSELTAKFTEHISGIIVTKTTATEEETIRSFETISSEMKNSSYRASFYTAAFMPIVVLTGSLSVAIIIRYAAGLAAQPAQTISLGTLAAAFDYGLRIFMPVMDIAIFYSMAQRSLSAGERVFGLLEQKETIANEQGATSFDTIKGDISFKNVSFAYNSHKKVLTGFNLDIRAGESIALVGATGEGKSTITNLIGRFYEPTEGRIEIDGIDYMSKTLHSLRSQLGVVLQTPHLFKGTIFQNIAYSKPTTTAAEVESTLQYLGAADLLPKLYEEVGESGDRLSQGERQLVSFARAIIADPSIFIMDEATSSVDTLTEAMLQASIQQLIKGRTSIIIAHRLSTIKNCDRILVIHQGKIIEQGNHKQLLGLRGRYYSLYTNQLQEERVRSVF